MPPRKSTSSKSKVKTPVVSATKKKKNTTDPKKLYDEYYDLYEEYIKKYEKVALLMQVGGFYEMYAPKDLSRTNITDLTKILNCSLTRKNNQDPDSPYMSGFPLVSIDKNVLLLVEHAYTVIVVQQSDNLDDEFRQVAADPSNKSNRKSRLITQVVSSGTLINSPRLRCNILCIFCKEHSKDYVSFAFAIIDQSISRKITIHEIDSVPDDKGIALDTAIQFVSQFDPAECIIVTKNGESPNILKHLGLTCQTAFRDVQMIHTDLEDNEGFEESGLSVFLSYAVGTLKTFLKEHHISIKDIELERYHPEKIMDLSSTAIKQLDLPMFLARQEINKTETPMGNRLFHNRMFNPIMDPTELKKRYDAVESLNKERVEKLKEVFKECPDLDKFHRMLSVNTLSWGHFCRLKSSYEKLLGLFNNNSDEDEAREEVDVKAKMETLLKEVDDTFDFNFTDSVPHFRMSLYPDLDSHINTVHASKLIIDDFIEKALKIMPKKEMKIQDDGIKTSKLRGETTLKQYKDYNWKSVSTDAGCILYTEEYRNSTAILNDAEKDLEELLNTYFKQFQNVFYNKWRETIEKLSQWVAERDFEQCSWQMAQKFHMTRPQLVKEKCLKIDGLRHLLIELINQENRYIPNDLHLSESGTLGYLLYGVNSCGKTSYLKAVGLAVVLAQAGMFVPATFMQLCPLKRIMTRIAGGDNMERSQSSFIVEVEELQSVIQRSTSGTLVLGDEICRGTEIDSANAMVYATLHELCDKNTFFVTATHLHGIAGKVRETLQDKVKIFHMHVTFVDGEPLYNRILTPGSGMEKYGLEIAKAKQFPSLFLERAFAFRSSSTRITEISKVDNTTFATNIKSDFYGKPPAQRKSRYNTKKVLVKCENCHYKPDSMMSLPLDTHHIEFQCNADDDGFHGSQHKHALHNLVALCKICHVKVHKRELVIVVEQGLKGRKLRFDTPVEIFDNTVERDDVEILHAVN